MPTTLGELYETAGHHLRVAAAAPLTPDDVRGQAVVVRLLDELLGHLQSTLESAGERPRRVNPGPATPLAVARGALRRTAGGLPAPAPPAPPDGTGPYDTLGFADTSERIATTARALLDALASAGAVVVHDVPVRLPDPAPCWSALRGHSAESPDGVTRQIAVLEGELARVFAEADVIATPTTPNPPHGHRGPGDVMSVALTWAFNISGHPAISLPAGTTPTGEPVGLQLIARRHREVDLLAVAATAERCTLAGGA